MVATTNHIKDPKVESILAEVYDPEIPVLSILDMGIVHNVVTEGNKVIIDIIPTYSGCPAMDTISDDIKHAFKQKGITAEVKLKLSPAWSTDMISVKGRENLEAYGIAAPLSEELDKRALIGNQKVLSCPKCQSKNTKMISQFGSTACKALFQCNDCLEPFDYFKCLK